MRQGSRPRASLKIISFLLSNLIGLEFPSVKAWLDAKNMTADQGYAYFVQKTAAIAIAQGHRPVQWSEVFDHFKDKLDKKVIIHIWKSVTVRMKMSPSSVTLFCHVGDRTLCW